MITTVSRLADLDAIADSDLEPRVLVEVQTSMRRHGIRLDHLGAVTPLLQRVRFEGGASICRCGWRAATPRPRPSPARRSQ